MKTMLLALTLLIPVALTAQDDTVTIKKSELTADQLKQVQEDSKWTGMGHEIGQAVNESLSAVTDNAQKFSQTGVGRLTAALVIWKVAGSDFRGMVAGILMLFTVFPTFVFFYWRNCTVRRVLIKKTKDGEREWKIINDDPKDRGDEVREVTVSRFIHLVPFIILTLIACGWIGGCSMQ